MYKNIIKQIKESGNYSNIVLDNINNKKNKINHEMMSSSNISEP